MQNYHHTHPFSISYDPPTITLKKSNTVSTYRLRDVFVLVGVGVGFNIDLESTHVVEQLSFSLFPSTLTFDFDSILG